MDPAELVEGVRRQDPVALRQLDDGHRRRLTAFCRGRLHNPDEAEDCVQETFMTALARIDTLESPENLRNWLTGIAKRKVMERNRRHLILVNRLADAAMLEIDLSALADRTQDTARIAGKREMLSVVGMALHSLTPQLRAVMMEVIREPGISGTALAARLNWTVQKAEHELSRGRAELAKAIGIAFVVGGRRDDDCPELAALCLRLGVPGGRRVPLTPRQRRAVQGHLNKCSSTCRPRAVAGRDSGAWAIGTGLLMLTQRQREPDPAAPAVVAAQSTADSGRAGLEAGFWQRGSDAFAQLGAKVAQLPGFSTALRVMQSNPGAIRAASATVVLAAAATAALAFIPGPSEDDPTLVAPSRSAVAPIPESSAIPQPAVFSPADQPGAVDPALGPVRTGDTLTPPATGTGEPPQTSSPGDGRFAVTIDAAKLSAPRLAIAGVAGNLDKSKPQTVWLKPGTYQLGSGNVWTAAWFTVTPTGAIDYPQDVTYLSGRGTGILTLKGFAVNVDATRLTSPLFAVGWVAANVDARRVQTFNVLPATYRLASGNIWTAAWFTVTPTGAIDYPQDVTYLSGRGTDTLTLKGFTIYVDATRLTASTFAIEWVGATFDARRVQTVQVLPATYRLAEGSTWSAARVSVTVTGAMDYAQTISYLSGRGTETLTILTSRLPPA
ncbi:RNA polymerase sigma factor [Allorhizocola rhizosphaerae]|uniref:RNA polymerase sigma factor n=1 Tax=Allorhizocola rhizosphaerae TaxID=1872709 RepID=UPI0013C33D7D|nr:sigma-70 family RNA polymerase sigma factor [Allorhizocola rhizosphaerae]